MKLCIAFITSLLLLLCLNAADPTIPLKEYDGLIKEEDLIKRINDNYPLSDQKNKGGWKLNKSFSDEFSHKKLNSRKWYPTNPQWKGRPPTQFHQSNVSLEDGELVFRINQHENEELLPEYTHSAGYIKSKKTILYGYFEMEAKLMDAPWVSGFWLYDATEDWWTEIDICENNPGDSKRRRDLHSNVHVFKAPKNKGNVKKHFQIGQKHQLPFDLQEDYHVWGLEWNKKVIRFYIDGALFREIENTHWHQPLTINLNNESNIYFDAVPDDRRLNKEYRVKYVRVWRKLGN